MYFFFLAYDTLRRVESTALGFEWGIVALFSGIGSLLLLFALMLLRIPPINAARLRFRSGGFRLETKQVFRRGRIVDLDWAEVCKVSLHIGGLYGGSSIRMSHGRAGEVAFFSPAWTTCSSKEVIDRLMTSAEAAGFKLEKEAVGWKTFSQERWTVIQKV